MDFDKKKLKKDIEASGLKLGFIADKALIHRSYLYMILKGVRTPSSEALKRIYDVILK